MRTRRHLALFSIASAVILLYGFATERYALRLNEYPLYFEDLPDGFDGYRILLVADLHYGLLMSLPWAREIMRRANGAGADLVVCLGDYVKKRNATGELTAVWPLLKTLSAPDGVWFINGNHDHWADHRLALRLLGESGASLRHRHVVLGRKGSRIALAGSGDARGGDEPGLETALAGVPAGMFTIMLAHNPDAADLPRGRRVDLFLCGHTHGGQIVVPFIDYPVMVPVHNRSYDSGLRHNARREAVFISRGIGWSILPLRLNCPPELALVRLMKR